MNMDRAGDQAASTRMLETMAHNLLSALARAGVPASTSTNPAPTPILTTTPKPTPAPAPSSTASPASRINNALKRQFPGMYSGGTAIRGKARFKTPDRSPRVTHLPVFVLPGPTSVTPKGSMELELAHAGLGKKVVLVPECANHSEIVSLMEGEYMKLKPLMGRWMFFKATGGSGQRKLSIIPIDSEGYSGRQLRMASNNGKNVLFLVPLQEELETAPLPFSSPEFSKMPKVACNNCLEIIPLQMLALHSESCQTAKEQTDKIIDVNDDEDDEGDDDADVDCTVGKGVCPICQLEFPATELPHHANICAERSFNIEEDMDPNLPGSSSSNSTLPLPGPSTQTTEVWKTAAPSEAVRLFMEDLRRGGDHQPPLRLTLNAGDTDEERDGTLISFYKQRRETCQWAADFRCSILGNAGVTAIFEGQREHLVPNLCTAILESDLFAMAGRMVGHSSIHGGPSLSGLSPAVLDALTRGTKDIVTSKLCLEDCPEIEVRDTISLLLKEEWTEAESVRVADLCTEWYFPVPTKETNRLLLFQQLLSHAVLGRANAQIKQFRKGIKETGIWPLLTARPDVLPLLFPRETDVELTPQMVLKCIIWPEASIDSDDSEDEMSTTNINLISGFFRAFVKEASSDVLKGLMKFWTGWELPSPRLTFKVVRSRGHHHLPTASTCYERLRIPDHYKSGSALKLDLHACIESVQSGFGLI
ncbi:uncharacterized protein LOC109142316 isoform X2 [Larimichthys crocea]|uniref:uncharacterized protein LOC109142316 isoform X2 n=1 Tax=Larimichthys crocea TaxID=215358 RepID=UPI000F5FA812|nr:uncharacterized protein LOC109142316 isoform X2 [Larimichthys crocea]